MLIRGITFWEPVGSLHRHVIQGRGERGSILFINNFYREIAPPPSCHVSVGEAEVNYLSMISGRGRSNIGEVLTLAYEILFSQSTYKDKKIHCFMANVLMTPFYNNQSGFIFDILIY